MSNDEVAATSPTGSPKGVCPHCDTIVDLGVVTGLTDFHNWPRLTRQVCPGSQQNPTRIIPPPPFSDDEVRALDELPHDEFSDEILYAVIKAIRPTDPEGFRWGRRDGYRVLHLLDRLGYSVVRSGSTGDDDA